MTDKKWRIFQARRTGVVPVAPMGLRFTKDATPTARIHPAPEAKKPSDFSVAEMTEKLLLTHHVPSCAVVNPEGQLIFLHGKTGKYLEPSMGKASLNILDMARDGLRPDLRSAIRKATTQKTDAVIEGIQVRTNGSFETINLTVHYIDEPEHLTGFLMVVFQDAPKIEPEKPGRPRSTSDKKLIERIEELELDLRYTKENLQSTIEEMETSNEELQSSNEELQSSNEELQSTNEEIETSKEELQSTNEELITVNAELQSKMDELAQANNDMVNLLSSTKIATLFLDTDLRIKRFTPDVAAIVSLIPSDVGRPISDFSKRVDYPDLEQDAFLVLTSLGMKEKVVQHVDKAWYLVRIIPYRTARNVIEGAVITFVEITEQKRMQALQDALVFARGIVDTVREPLIVLDADLRVISANMAFYEMFKTAPEAVERIFLYDIGNRQWDIPALRTALEEILPKYSVLNDFTVEHDFPAIGHRKMTLNARRIQSLDAETETILLAIEDLTEA